MWWAAIAADRAVGAKLLTNEPASANYNRPKSIFSGITLGHPWKLGTLGETWAPRYSEITSFRDDFLAVLVARWTTQILHVNNVMRMDHASFHCKAANELI